MTFQSVDRRRLSYLLSVGTQEGELKKFFDDSLKSLLSRGARIRNAPHGNEARIKLISERLPAATDEVMRQWFRRNITVLEPASSQQLIDAFSGFEHTNTSPTKEEASHLARSCLLRLFSDETDEQLLSFLRTPIPGVRQADVAVVTEDLRAETNESDPQNVSHNSLLKLLALAFEGGELGDVLDQLPEDLANFVEGLSRISRGDERSAQDALSAISPESEEAEMLARSIKRMRSAGRIPSSQQGLMISRPSEFQGDADAARSQVLGYCTNGRASATFVKPLGVIRHGHLEIFTEEQRIEFFPETGDVMAFSGPGRPKQPIQGEMGIWDIEEHPTDKRTHCHLTKEGAELYSVVTVPVHSSDADSVRNYIKQSFEMGSNGRRIRLYELLDGVIISPKNFRADLSRDETFEQPFNRWAQLVGFAFEDQRLVVGPLPEPDSTYDCAPIAIAVRSLLRTLRDQQKTQLTKGQIRDVVALFQDRNYIVSRQRMARIVERAESAEFEETVLNDMLEFVLETSAFKERIEEGVQQRIDVKTREKEGLQAEIARLNAERTASESRLRAIEKTGKKQAADTANLVKQVFEKAISNGLETLVSSRIFETLGSSTVKVLEQPQEAMLPKTAARIGALAGIDHERALRLLKACGMNKRFAIFLIAAVSISCRAGIVVFLKGEFARQVAETVSCIEKEAISFDVPMGLTSRAAEITYAVASERPFVIFNANLSDFELYASEVTDRIVARIAGQSGGRDFLVVGNLIDGDLGLPLSASTRHFSLTIDLGWSADYELSAPHRDDMGDFSETLQTSALNQILSENLLANIEQLPPLEQGGVASIIKRALAATRNPLIR